MQKPETLQVTVDGLRIAYQSFGSGPRTLVGIPGFAQHLDLIWEQKDARRFFERLGEICRVVHFDKRGTGMSDRGVSPPSLDQRVRDIEAVMDAAEVDHAVLGGWSEGVALATFFAATFPQRVDGLILSGGFATWTKCDDHPWAKSARRHHLDRRLGTALWGTGLTSALLFAPSMARTPSFWRWARSYEKAALDRRDFAPTAALNEEIDTRGILGSVQAPTLVLHGRGDRLTPARSSRFIVERISGARFVEFPTRDHAIWFAAQDSFLDEMEGFLRWRAEHVPDRGRLLATVLFTDIVDSTAEASRLGDARWLELLDHHDGVSRAEVERHAGRWIKSTGDGILATFDSPAGAIRCADTLRHRLLAELGLRTRTGLHTAEIELRGADVGGVAVHQAARIQATAGPMEIRASAAVRHLTPGAGISYEDQGWHTLKGIPENCNIFLVTAVEPRV